MEFLVSSSCVPPFPLSSFLILASVLRRRSGLPPSAFLPTSREGSDKSRVSVNKVLKVREEVIEVVRYKSYRADI